MPVPSTLPKDAKKIFEDVYQSYKDKGLSDEEAAKRAWGAIKSAFHKDEQSGMWVKNKGLAEFSMRITKSVFDTKTNKMRWNMTASDTGEDFFGERMSLELYNNFVKRIENEEKVPEMYLPLLNEKSGWDGGMPYLSVSHYKSGPNGSGIPGMPEVVYTDGEMLKAKGTFYDTPLGRAVFKSVNEDMSGNSKYPLPTRVSIGFLDFKHSHGNFVFERKSLEDECPMCKSGVGDKIYLDGQLVHFAFTRVPARETTSVEVDKSMEAEIKSREQDAESIVQDPEIVKTLEVNRSAILVERSDEPVVEEAKTKKTDVPCDPETPEEDVAEGEEEPMPMDKKKKMPMKDALVEDAKAKPYGNVEYADTKNNKYPIDTEEHIRAAWNYIHVAKNAAEYSSSELSSIRNRIVAAWKSKIDKAGPPSAETKKSELELAFDELINAIEQNKSLPKEDALKNIQPSFDALGVAVQKSFAEPVQVIDAKDATSEQIRLMAEEFKTALSGLQSTIQELTTEVAVLKSANSATKIVEKKETVQPRSALKTRSLNSVNEEAKPKLKWSIKELADRSVGLS